MATDVFTNVDLGSYSAADRAILEEALEIARGRNWSARQFSAGVGTKSETVLHKVYHGKYDGDTAGVIGDLERFVAAERGRTLINTQVTEQYLVVLNSVRRFGRMGLIAARTGRGKTLTADTWISGQPSGTAHRIQIPSNCSRADLVRLCARARGIDVSGQTEPAQEAALLAGLSRHSMIIFDEVDNLILPRRRTTSLRLLQDIHDLASVPVVAMMRPSAWAEFVHGRRNRDDEQILGRMPYRCIVPDRYLRDEIEALLAPFLDGDGVTPQLRSVVRDLLGRDDGGLRALVADCCEAAEFAASSGQPFATALASVSSYRSRGGDWDEKKNPSF